MIGKHLNYILQESSLGNLKLYFTNSQTGQNLLPQLKFLMSNKFPVWFFVWDTENNLKVSDFFNEIYGNIYQ